MSLDEFCRLRGDTRLRATADGKASVATVAAAEPLAALPATPYPAILPNSARHRGRRWCPTAATATRCHRSWRRRPGHRHPGPGSRGDRHRHRHRADHHRPPPPRPDGAGVIVRDHGHVYALEHAAMAAAAAAGGRPHRRKDRIPPGPEAAIAAAAALRRHHGLTPPPPVGVRNHTTTTDPPPTAVIDLSAYERAARGRNTLA